MPTGVDWADETWNPLLGCARVSKGCDFCYAITGSNIRAANPDAKVSEAFAGLVERRDGRLDWTGKVNLLPQRLAKPLHWRKPRKVFVNSMSDLFHDAVPDGYIAAVFVIMAAAKQHFFQVLTKRHGRMRSLLNSPGFQELMAGACRRMYHEMKLPIPGNISWKWPLPNVWLGVSVEDQKTADLRIPALLATPAAVRWLSCEPLLGPVDLRSIPYRGDSDYQLDVLHQRYRGPGQPATDGWGTTPFRSGMAGLGGIDWVVAGGESGAQARPMQLQWALDLRDQVVKARVPFNFKQWGAWVPPSQMPDSTFMSWDVEHGTGLYNFDLPWRVGKKRAGRLLDGRLWDEYPAHFTPSNPLRVEA